MSRRFVYDGGSGTTQGDLLQGQQFVYDGLTLHRVDQIYDDDAGGLSDTDEWRVWWENTTMPALLGGHLAKRIYSYPSGTSGTSNGSTDTYYAYDAIGNVVALSDSAGSRQYHFTQDAFGNELTQDSFGGDSWDTAHDDGIWEHQTGKWMDGETGLYFFSARWYDAKVGRFVGRTELPRFLEGAYEYCNNDPIQNVDLDGNQSMNPAPRPELPKWAACGLGCGLVALGVGIAMDKIPPGLDDLANAMRKGGMKASCKKIAKILSGYGNLFLLIDIGVGGWCFYKCITSDDGSSDGSPPVASGTNGGCGFGNPFGGDPSDWGDPFECRRNG